MDDLLTTKQLQDLLRIDRTTIYRMLNDGRLTGIKVGGQWRFPRKEVESLLSGARPSEEKSPTLSTDILPLHCVQALQSVFAEIADVGSVTVAPDGEPLTTISNPCSFCTLMLNSESGRRACVASWRKLVEQTEHRQRFITCHAGLQYTGARIEVNGTFIAMLVAGQFYSRLPDADEEAARALQLAEAHGIDPEALAEAAHNIPVLDDTKQARLGGWLKTVARAFEDIGHERAELMSRLRRIAAMSTFNSE
jgi:excisionase family DNA binding protein